jgi:hypothetical protein
MKHVEFSEGEKNFVILGIQLDFRLPCLKALNHEEFYLKASQH